MVSFLTQLRKKIGLVLFFIVNFVTTLSLLSKARVNSHRLKKKHACGLSVYGGLLAAAD